MIKNPAIRFSSTISPFLKKYSTDERNYVKKAVNWALRQIGQAEFKTECRSDEKPQKKFKN